MLLGEERKEEGSGRGNQTNHPPQESLRSFLSNISSVCQPRLRNEVVVIACFSLVIVGIGVGSTFVRALFRYGELPLVYNEAS